jgi:hypothetical protein
MVVLNLVGDAALTEQKERKIILYKVLVMHYNIHITSQSNGK